MHQSEISAAISETVNQLLADGGYRRYAGQYSEQLTSSLTERFAAHDVLLTSSGTAAVEIALRAAAVGPGDEVLLSAYDYPGNFWAIERVGAKPVLLDVEAEGWRLAASDLEQITHRSQASTGTPGRYKALVVSHLHGQLQSMAELRQSCDRLGIWLIEDACQGIGATLGGRLIGTFGHASIISFGGGKLLSAGRGGGLCIFDAGLSQRARILSGAGSGPYTMSELQAAVVVAQLPWLEELVAQGRRYFSQLAECVQSIPTVAAPFAACAEQTSFYQAGLLVGGCGEGITSLVGEMKAELIPNQTPASRAVDALRSRGVPAGVGFAGFHRRSSRRCRTVGELRHVADVVRRTVTIHHAAAWDPALTPDQLARLLGSS